MRSHTATLLAALLLLTACNNHDNHNRHIVDAQTEIHTLYTILDSEIANSQIYEAEKCARIADLKKSYEIARNEMVSIDIANRLIKEYEAFNADSALYYVNQNLDRQELLSHPGEYTSLIIKRADIYAHAGLFQDAITSIQAVPRDSLIPDVLEQYYATWCLIYQYLNEYTDEHLTSMAYERRRSEYLDSLSTVLQPSAFNHLVYIMTQRAREGKPQEAIQTLTSHLHEYAPGTREYAIITSTLAYIYKISGNDDEYRKYLTLSAISDIRAVVKENMSFRELATAMFEDGDVERANRYLKKSIADATFYSSMLRNAQSSKMLPVIDGAYSSLQEQMTRRLRTMVLLSGGLACILIIALAMILKQFKTLRKANHKMSDINTELNRLTTELQESNTALHSKNDELLSLSDQLKSANAKLEKRNNDLRSYNRIKEQYAALFMEYCQSAISTLLQYQQSLRVMATQGGYESLRKKLESPGTFEQLMKNFYTRFDEAILNIYPSFVEKFNKLLKPEERITLKAGELLNTELRLYALVRIGIEDNAKIAQFLRCSISTVYTYRSKIRKRAINTDTFEDEIRNII